MSITLEIQTLYKALQEKLGLVWISGEQYSESPLHSNKGDSPEISLVGHLNLIIRHRVQIIGKRELEYLDSLKKNSRCFQDSQHWS